MELRSKTKQKEKEEYEELKLTLKGMGFFEEQMELQEMQDIMQALQMSEPSALGKKNESQTFFHSTMIDTYETSPEPASVTQVVEVLVHHPMDWSPPGNDSLLDSINARKRNIDQINNETAKRLRYDSIENVDSGVSSLTSPNTSPHKNNNATELSKLFDPLEINNNSTAIENGTEKFEAERYKNFENLSLEELSTYKLLEANNDEGAVQLPSLFKSTQTAGCHDADESWD